LSESFWNILINWYFIRTRLYRSPFALLTNGWIRKIRPARLFDLYKAQIKLFNLFVNFM